jgi:hypothetical protein
MNVARVDRPLTSARTSPAESVWTHGVPATFGRMRSALEASVDRSSRRHGQFLVVVGALLGALVGVVLGLAVKDPQSVAAVAAPERAHGAVSAVTPPSSRPAASQAAGPGNGADGDQSGGRQRTRVTDRPHHGHGKAHKAGKEDGENHKEPHGRANGAPGKGGGHTGKGSDR